MNVSEPFIRRPVATTLVMAAILLLGFAAYRALPVSDLPSIDLPTLSVSAALPGASPETMAASVATPLEKQFSTIAGVSSMSSTNTLGNTSITIQFELSRDLDAAAQDVQAAIAASLRDLPADLPAPPSFKKVNPADQPILYLALTSPTLPLSDIDEYGETMLAQRISMVDGVAQVQVYGSQKYAVRVMLDPRALASRGIGIDEVSQAIRNENVNLPTGKLAGPDHEVTIEAQGQLTNAAAYRPLIVAYRAGKPVRLEELGEVLDSVEDDETAAWYVDQRAVVLAIQRQPGTNTVRVSDGVRALLPAFESKLPPSVKLKVIFDRSQGIRESVRDVQLTLLFTILLVVGVIFIFLRNGSATLIPSLALPLSLVGTAAVMYLLGFTLDNLSLMALTLSVGFVVDDAIVMLENVFRHREMGKPRMISALDGAREVGFTIVSMTLSLVAVFIPILFMGGIVGRLFNEFSLTIAVALLISGFVSLTLTPMLASRFLREESQHGRFYRTTEAAFSWMVRVYGRWLDVALDHRRLVLVLSLLVLALTGWLFVAVPKGFLPTEDQGQLFAFTEAQEGVSFPAMSVKQQALARILKDNPAVEGFMSSVGSRGRGSATGVLFARLKPRGERPTAQKVIDELRPRLAQVPGIRTFLQIPPPIRLSGQLTKSQYQLTLQGTDTAELFASAPTLEKRMHDVPGLIDVTSDLRLSSPQLTLTVDRDRAAAQGVTMAQVEGALYDAYGKHQVSTIYTPTNAYRVMMQLAPEFQRNPESLELLHVRSTSGQLVPLDAIAGVKPAVGPQSVNHSGQLPSVTLSFNLAEGASLGPAVEKVEAIAREVLPPSITVSLQGTAGAFQDSLGNLGWLLLLAVLVIYLVLGILYESFIHPLTILSALPFAGFGALVTLLLFGRELDVYAFVGVILLVGLVKKNGIMMVDFAVEAQRAGKTAREAIHEACMVRFRPILMTSVAAFVGTLPIALGLGAGGESRQPLGLAVVGGLLFSQTLTLLVTPVFYLYMDRLQNRVKRAASRADVELAPAAE